MKSIIIAILISTIRALPSGYSSSLNDPLLSSLGLGSTNYGMNYGMPGGMFGGMSQPMTGMSPYGMSGMSGYGGMGYGYGGMYNGGMYNGRMSPYGLGSSMTYPFMGKK